MTIGNRIKTLRKQLNYSQEYIAEQLNVSRQAVSITMLGIGIRCLAIYLLKNKNKKQ